MPVDFFGDYLYNKAHHRRPHDGVLAAWADAHAMRALDAISLNLWHWYIVPCSVRL